MNFFKTMLGSLSLYDSEEEEDYFFEESEHKSSKKNRKARILPIQRNKYEDLDRLTRKENIPFPLMNQINRRKQDGFSITLMKYIDRSTMKDSVLYKRAGIDRKHFSKIRSNVNYSPTKNTVLAFVIALELSLEEAQHLLMSAGYSLSDSFETDIIVSYYLERGVYDIHIINDMLYRRNLSII